MANALDGQETTNVLLWELYFSGTDQSKFRDALVATGLDAAVVLYRSRDYLADLAHIFGQLGPRLRMVSVSSGRLTPDFLERMDELGLRLMISGFAGPEDHALVNEADPAPWMAALELGFVASTDQPHLLLEAMGR